MEEKRLLKKLYSITIHPFQDAANEPRRELDIIPEFVYETSQSLRDERNMHMVWYSSPDLQQYNTWDFQHLLIGSEQREILSENAFLSEIMALSDNIQPQEFEQMLQRSGFQRE